MALTEQKRHGLRRAPFGLGSRRTLLSPFLGVGRFNPFASYLASGYVETVPDIGNCDGEKQRCQHLFVVMLLGVVPDIVGHWVRAVAEPSTRFRKRQSS